ncbi:hypothetical protein WA171_000257 [Blastocystis sp. BT1]
MNCLSLFFLIIAIAQCAPSLIVEKGVDTPSNYIGCNHPFTIMYRVDNIGEETVYNVTISDQWPAEGFDIDVEFPIIIEELEAGDKFEKNATAIPRQSGYLETARAMYEYAYYKDEELAQARGMSTSIGTLPILQEAQFLRITSSFMTEYIILGVACFVTIVIPFLRWLNLSTNGKVKSE